ncbi:serine/threonine-protein kinase [Geothrix sp. 21YS21S-4]|uniref:serine/threonine-protein kinase n=1 Tax=Geothrix sp. 21YS21S-4 TaxID=3068889 RepID=UPI0027B9144C|nr:serine/threonine-protein kinase [Geothrix sp. 21YS21S-4]
MSRPLLLLVDGEPLRTPGLASALESDGWTPRWIHASEAGEFLRMGMEPALLVMGPAAPRSLAHRLRERRPRLPVVTLSHGGDDSLPDDLEIQGALDGLASEAGILELLRRHRPEPAGPAAPDLFGDLLTELESEPGGAFSPGPFALFEGPGRAPGLPAPPAFQAPLSAADIFGSVLEELDEVEAPPAGKPARVLPPSASEAGITSDFTLSGLAGVHDPFDRSGLSVPVQAPASAPRPAVEAPEALEEYGNYFLLEKIAVGGMAELFKAQQRGVQGFQKIVAIKRILPHFSDNEDFVTMFIDEAKLAAQLTHPNIVQIFDLGKAGSSYYIAMEYVNGRDLRTLLRRAREHEVHIPEQVAAFIVMKVAAALDYAHRKRGFDDRELKLVHRDVSPQNILLSSEGAVKLVDFGIAKAATKASHTVSGALKGKLLYMSPEQATGQSLDNRSDVYSLGLVLFELLTRERCFQADTELGVLEKVRLGRISDLNTLNPEVSQEMAAIVNRALQKGVDHRYPSARFMERDLRDYLQRQGSPLVEHDVAEYANTLLNGTREDLERLTAARFQVSGSTTGADRTLGARSMGSAPRPAAPAPAPDLPLPKAAVARPRWMLPLIVALAALLVGLLLLARMS